GPTRPTGRWTGRARRRHARWRAAPSRTSGGPRTRRRRRRACSLAPGSSTRGARTGAGCRRRSPR
ncbi:unnamed protein product, partial [Prorocentrum cordatum]